MKGIKKASDEEFRASDAVLDPPAASNARERRKMLLPTLAGAAIGGGIGGGIGYHQGKKYYSEDPVKQKGAAVAMGLPGASIGSALGNMVGNYNVMKDRKERGEPVKKENKLPEVKYPHERVIDL